MEWKSGLEDRQTGVPGRGPGGIGKQGCQGGAGRPGGQDGAGRAGGQGGAGRVGGHWAALWLRTGAGSGEDSVGLTEWSRLWSGLCGLTERSRLWSVALWAHGMERTLWAHGTEWTLWAHGERSGLCGLTGTERTLWAHGTERTLWLTERSGLCGLTERSGLWSDSVG